MARSCTRDEPYQQSRYMESAMSCSKAKKRSARISLPPQGCCLCAKGTQIDINPHYGDGAHALLFEAQIAQPCSDTRSPPPWRLPTSPNPCHCLNALVAKCVDEPPRAMSNHATV